MILHVVINGQTRKLDTKDDPGGVIRILSYSDICFHIAEHDGENILFIVGEAEIISHKNDLTK
jgi:hypothetical protein